LRILADFCFFFFPAQMLIVNPVRASRVDDTNAEVLQWLNTLATTARENNDENSNNAGHLFYVQLFYSEIKF